MMLRRVFVVAALCAVPLVLVAQQAGASTFSGGALLTIPGGAPAQTAGPASAYPSTINVAEIPGSVADVNVTLDRLTHTCMSDLRILLVGPGGQNTLVLDTAGGYCDPPIVNGVITLDDQ